MQPRVSRTSRTSRTSTITTNGRYGFYPRSITLYSSAESLPNVTPADNHYQQHQQQLEQQQEQERSSTLRYRGGNPRAFSVGTMVAGPLLFGGAIYGMVKMSGAKGTAQLTGVFGRSRVIVQAAVVIGLVAYAVKNS